MAARKWTCRAVGNLQAIGRTKLLKTRVFGIGQAASEDEACREAKRDAVRQAPKGTYARHLKCMECSQ